MKGKVHTEKTSRLEFARTFGVMILAQLVFTGLATCFTPLSVRPLVMASVMVVSTLIMAAWLRAPRKSKSAAVILATAVSTVCIYGWRQMFDRLSFLGSVPSSLEIPALGVCAGLTISLGVIVALASDRSSRAYRFRWILAASFSLVVGVLTILGAERLRTASGRQLPEQLKHVLQLEARLDSAGIFERQDLSFWLEVFGRGSEARAFSTRYAAPVAGKKQVTTLAAEMEKEISAKAVAWREAITEIAARERVVILMEAHNATQHREWIERTLPIFSQAGFSHYAAETLSETGEALKKRGYPVQTTGAYVADPRFGNLLRRVIGLDFAIHEYETQLAFEPEQREEEQARTLAKIIAANPSGKIVIHAGYAHAFKQPVPRVGKCMAARLWEITGVEPYCIYQAQDEFDSPNYPRLVELAGATDEPRMLIPPPLGLTDPQFSDIPAGAIDALVIHPIAKGKPPVARKPTFSSDLTRVSGRWLESQWPIVVGAYREGETADAIALDQVMLRPGESEFELWMPAQPYVLRVTSPDGNVAIEVEKDQATILVRRAAASEEHRRAGA